MGAITVTNLGKAYKQYPTRWARLAEWLLPGHKSRHTLHWVLQDINFIIQPGEAVGIIGINGAGKSTLLKMITGTTQPTTGSVQITGRVAALLELGMGFHPDFTGRQNVCMAGQLLGYNVEEITSLMPEIEAFAEIGDYIDQPVRVYSSGMQMRLAFSVATAHRPDILIVDEALSVGDAAFQRKCFRRIESYCAEGTTLLFVSHDTETMKKICDTVIFLKDGLMEQYGPAKSVCDAYEKILFGGGKINASGAEALPEKALLDPALQTGCTESYGDERARIEKVWLEDNGSQLINVIPAGTGFFINYLVRFDADVVDPVFAMMIKTREGIAVYGTDTLYLKSKKHRFSAGAQIRVSFQLENNLVPGIYYLNCGVRDDSGEKPVFMNRLVDVAIFRVTHVDEASTGTGLADMRAFFALEKRT